MSDTLQTQIDVLAEAARDRENIRNKLRAAHEQELAHMNELTAEAQATSARIKALAAELVRYEDKPAPARTVVRTAGTGRPRGRLAQNRSGTKGNIRERKGVFQVLDGRTVIGRYDTLEAAQAAASPQANGPTKGWARMPEPPAAEDWGSHPPTAAE
jgi:conjugal transfer/entry exclusion protein